MEKSRDAFRTISEVAEWLGTPTHVLRFWESRFSQVKPVKRAGGRRYYRPSDMELLGGIKKLLHDDGLTIRGVQKILREEGVKHVIALSPPVESGDDAAMAIDVEAVEDTGNVVQLSPQASEPQTPPEPEAARADTAADEAQEPASPEPSDDRKAGEPVVAFSHADPESPQAPEAEPAASPHPAAAEARESPVADPKSADEAAEPSEEEAPIAPAPAAPPGHGIFATPPVSPDFAPQGPQPIPEPEDKSDKPAKTAAPQAGAPEAEPSGPDLDALRPIYKRLVALRDRMASGGSSSDK